MAEKKDRESGKQLIYIQTASIEDISRAACRFDSTPGETLLSKYKNKWRVIYLHEDIDDSTIALYTEVAKPGGLIRYYYGPDEKENAVFVDSINRQDPDSCYINVLEMDLSKIKEPKKVDPKSVTLIKMSKIDDFMKGILRRSMRREYIEHAYVFPYKGGSIIGAFDIIEGLSDGKTTFYYVMLDKKINPSFARYDYVNNKSDFSNEFGNHSYMYVKIINLTEPFKFFKV